MIPLNKGSYIKHVYKINVIECYDELVKRIEQELPEGGKKDHFKMIFEVSLNCFQESVGIKPRMRKNGVKYKTLHEIETSHPAFYNWLAYFLTLQNPLKITQILNSYRNEIFGQVPNFNNIIEYRLLSMLSHVPINHKEQDEAVNNWISENNYPLIDEYETIKNYFQDETVTPKLKLHPEGHKKLQLLFSEYYESKNTRKIYNYIFKGNHVKDGYQIYLSIKANIFCDALKRICNNGGVILSKKTKIAHWVVTNFLFEVKGTKKSISLSYCTQLLAGRESPDKRDEISLLELYR
jgi:hypothetical protein